MNKLNTTLNPEKKRGRQDERKIVVVVVVVSGEGRDLFVFNDE